jgi:hypothetical protein
MHNKAKLEATLTDDEISLVPGDLEDAFEYILQRYGDKQDDLYRNIERELKEVQKVARLVCAVPTAPSAPSSSQTAELGYEPAQLRRFVDATESQFQRAREEKEKATESLQKEKDQVLA